MFNLDERYQTDPMFKQVVDCIAAWVLEYKITPTEAREAAMLACIKVENTRPTKPFLIGPDD